MGVMRNRKSSHGMFAEIRNHRGAPALFVNGKPCSAMTYMTYDKMLRHFKDFAAVGVPLGSFSTTADYSYYNLAPTAWIAPGKFDYSDFDRRMATILAQNPNVYLLPRLYCSTPPWWNKAHPSEMSRGDVVGSQEQRNGPYPSFSSAAWRHASGTALRRFILRAEAQPYADRIIGYHIAAGSTEEWYYPDFWSDVDRDFSEPQRQMFTRWLRRHYKTAARLKSVWQNPMASFSNVTIPSRAERMNSAYGVFREPRGPDRRVVDYYAFHNEIVAEAIAHFARIAKDACGKRKIVGVFYGYIFGYCPAEFGHLAMRQLLKNPDVDFFTAPSSYSFRTVAEGTAAFMAPVAAIRHHGKFWFDENDYRTHLTPFVSRQNVGFSRSRTGKLRETVAVQLRELALVLAEAAGMWWFDMSGGWYDQPAMMQSIGRMNGIARRALDFNRASDAEIAVVLDEHSMMYLRRGTPLSLPLLSEQSLQLYRLGAPVDAVFLDDIDKLPSYKMYIFLNSFHLTPKQRKLIDSAIKRRGQTAIWVYVPGLIGNTISAENVERVTGIKIAVSREYAPMEIVTLPNTTLTRMGCPSWLKYGPRDLSVPMAACNDKEIEVLGRCEHIGSTGLAVKRFRNWTSIWSAAPCLPSALLRSAACLARVHIYTATDDPLYVNHSFLGIHARTGGTKNIMLRRSSAVYDVYNECRVVPAGTREFTIRMKRGDTRLFFLGDGRRWRG